MSGPAPAEVLPSAAAAVRTPPSLLHALEEHARQRGDRTAVRFLERGDAITGSTSYAALLSDVQAMAAGLLACDLSGKPVVLALPPGIPLIVALLACLRAGALAVPVPFPLYKEGRRRFAAVVADLHQAAIVTDVPAALDVDLTGRLVLSPSALMRESGAQLPPPPKPDDPALIQYSSGSTRTPRGIVLSHANMGSNAAMVREAFGTDDRLVGVNWLPPHHDMGLFGAIVQPLFVGGTTVLMPPLAFVQRPSRWLRAIQEHGGTMAGGPNFGYELCIRRIQPAQVRTLDLSTLEVAFCGAEPIRASTLRRFADHFAEARFKPSMFLPCYGLAEATLLVAAEHPCTGPQEIAVPSIVAGGPARTRISCGGAPTGCRISIRDPETGQAVPDGTAGEVCVAGPHLAIGEWHGPSATIVPPGGVLEEEGTRWLRTGDIGILSRAGLLVLDRLKDVIFCYGRNIHATDVEAAALEASDERVTAAAAFAVEGSDGEELVLLCEIRPTKGGQSDVEERRNIIVEAVAEQCGVAPRVVFLARGVLPRTTSGKIRRQVARRHYMDGHLRLIAPAEG